MSSSEPASPSPTGSARGFLLAFAATLAALASLFTALLLVIDPLGAGSGNALCPAGAKTPVSSDVKFVVPARLGPEVAVLGTSRVHYGFDSASLAELGQGAVTANLGLDGAATNAIGVLGHEVAATPGHHVLLVGVDFNMVHQQGEASVPPAAALPSAGQIGTLRAGWFNAWAFNALRRAWPACAVQIMPDGAPAYDAQGYPLGYERAAHEIAPLRQRLAGLEDEGPGAERLAMLRQSIARWQAQGHQVILFSAPYREEMLALIAETGAQGAFDRFRQQVDALARQQGAAYVDLSTPAAIAELGLPPCAQGGIGCHYYDMTHYKPLVARAMAPRLRAAIAPTARAPHRPG